MKDTQNIIVLMNQVHIVTKGETNKNTFKVQDAKESNMSKSFHIHRPTTMWTKRRIKALMVTIRKLYKDLEGEEDIHKRKQVQRDSI